MLFNMRIAKVQNNSESGLLAENHATSADDLGVNQGEGHAHDTLVPLLDER